MSFDTEPDPTVARILSRVSTEIAEGRKWRAREILQGAIRTHPTNQRILATYGLLLDDLGDRVEAGKYLFLSGHRGPEADPAIRVFLARYSKAQLGDLIRQFPRGIREADLADLPAVVRADLESLGLPKGAARMRRSMAERVAPPKSITDYAVFVGCMGAAVVLFVALLLGLRVILEWLGGFRP